MTLYCYLQPAAYSLSDPRGPILKKITSSTIVEANEAVSSIATKHSANRGAYAKFTVAQCASMQGIAAAKCRFLKEFYTRT